MQQVICDVPYRDEFIVRWRVQLRKNRNALSTFVEKDSPSSTGQRKVRLSEGRPILVTFHLSLVLLGATNIFSDLIHPLLKLPNCVLKQQLQILQLSEARGSAFSLFEKQEQALSAYCNFHPLMFDLPENTTLYAETTLKTALFSREINHRMCQIYKEDGIVIRFLTVQRHF